MQGCLEEDLAALRKLRDESGALKEFSRGYDDPREWKNKWEDVVWVADGRVTKLSLYKCTKLTALPAAIGELKALTTLDLSWCRNLSALPDAIGELKALTRLDLEGCSSLVALPDAIGELGSLTTLNLSRCKCVDELLATIGELKALTTLNLSGCECLDELPAAIGELKALTTLNLRGCSSLERLPDGIDGREGLNVNLPLQMDNIPAPLAEDFAALRKLRDESECDRLKQAWIGEDPREWPRRSNTVADGRVTELSLWGCSSLAALPDAIGDLGALTTLDLRECSSLAALPDAIGELGALTTLDLRECSSINALPDSIGKLGALTKLSLWKCSGLAELPAAIGELKALTELKLAGCESLVALPDSVGGLDALTKLDLAGCAKLTFPPPHMHGDLKQVKRLLANTTRLLDGDLSAIDADDVKLGFFDCVLDAPSYADRLEAAVRKTPALADLTNDKDERAIDLACLKCRRAMQKALFFLSRYDVDKTPPLHFSATAAVLGATDYDNDIKPRRALKAMRDPSAVLAELEGRAGLDSEFVVAVVGVHISEDVDAADRDKIVEAAGRLKISVDKDQDFGSLPGFLAKSDRGEVGNGRYEGFKYLVVMELADRSLGTALMHERIAANEWPLVRKIGGDLARALDALHVSGRVHCDFKPLNIVRVPEDGRDFTTFFSWQLIDLDVSCRIGAPFGTKTPSSGYCPPEMARVLIDALDQNDVLSPKKLGAYTASVAYDLWSFGVVLFHLGAAKSLWHTNQDDSIETNDLQTLAYWNGEQLKLRLAPLRNEGNKDMLALRDLVVKLLEPDPEKRLENFDGDDTPMQMVLRHPFLASKSLDDATLASLDRQIKQSHELLQTIDTKLDKVIGMLDAQFKMLSSLLTGVDAPKIICFLPVEAASDGKSDAWWQKMFAYKPGDLFNREVLVFFMDPLTLELAPTNNEEGFTVTFPRDWVVQAKPWLELGLTTLKVASVAGRLAGFPVPNVAGLVDGWLDGQLDKLNSLSDEAKEVIAAQTKNPKLAAKELEQLSTWAASEVDSLISDSSPVEGPALTSTLREPIKKSVEELDTILGSGWQEACGLVKEVSSKGETEWVLEKHAAEFKQNDAAFIKEKYGVKKDDPERTASKKDAVAKAESELKAIEEADTKSLAVAYDKLGGTSGAEPAGGGPSAARALSTSRREAGDPEALRRVEDRLTGIEEQLGAIRSIEAAVSRSLLRLSQ